MPRGESGRIVIEVEPEFKRRLYAALAMSGSTLKDWFLKAGADFCVDTVQPPLFPKNDPENPPATPRQPSPSPKSRRKK
jgi:hypothetical protein